MRERERETGRMVGERGLERGERERRVGEGERCGGERRVEERENMAE